MGGNPNTEESSEQVENNAESFSSEDKQQYEEALEVNLEQEISPETKDLRELEFLESTDAKLVGTENVSESSPEGAENSTTQKMNNLLPISSFSKSATIELPTLL